MSHSIKLVNNDDDFEELREQDRYLPIANVARIMKRALPENAKIAKEAKECVQECVSEFISFITSEASEKCINEKRKTINGEDVLWAMNNLAFDNYCETLRLYLHKYREATKVGTSQKDYEFEQQKLNHSHISHLQMLHQRQQLTQQQQIQLQHNQEIIQRQSLEQQQLQQGNQDFF
ncbi:hypothetical protein HK099_007532 [Clydaea vesicula]|uniref:Transcription factor CBF/NF-Y/archaeal histone domain-containing protein n=1 Tax=Clydaea vesicula TaxID=447962 RepID=A0AAD5TWQ0_9FUNG|nr:hypothetical protein HK099_007532 [Clydaea vesicula]KAJ3388227.1 hypothetical protein HDU92_001581 [Lobulomyces angularis]